MMAMRAFALTVLAIGASGCAAEQHTVVVERPRAVVVERVSDAQLLADSDAACQSYGLLRGTAPFDRCVRNEFAARRPG